MRLDFLSPITERAGLPDAGVEFRTLVWGDYDGDGWIDLYAGSADPAKPSALFKNTAGKRFADVAAEAGLAGVGRSSRQANWIDYDNDGDLDLYVTDRSFGERRSMNKLYRNDIGRFAEAFAGAGPGDSRSSVGACWLDFDRDGDLDLFLANQSGNTDALWRNDGSRFVDVAPELGMDARGRTPEQGGVGCAIGDYDNDGYLDIFEPSYGVNALWRGRPDGMFENSAGSAGVGVENHAVGAAWGDYDNDGFSELFVVSYEGGRGQEKPHNALFHNLGDGRFANVIEARADLNVADHGVGWIDFDGDGALDLSLTQGFAKTGGHFLFRNKTEGRAAKRSLNVQILDARGNHTQAGAEVRVYGADGKLLGTQQVPTGGGYGAQDAAPLHFGLPAARRVNVEVTFMSRSGRRIKTIKNVEIKEDRANAITVRRDP